MTSMAEPTNKHRTRGKRNSGYNWEKFTHSEYSCGRRYLISSTPGFAAASAKLLLEILRLRGGKAMNTKVLFKI
jgi:hypothetical protein